MAPITRRHLLAETVGIAGLASLPSFAAGKSERLKITKVDIFQVVVPIQDDIINSPEFDPDSLSEFPKGPKVIVKLHTDSGFVGIGETSRNVAKAGALENARHLTGQNALDLDMARLRLPNPATRSAFEIALYDVIGKAFGWPVSGRSIDCWEGWLRTRSTYPTGAVERIRSTQSG